MGRVYTSCGRKDRHVEFASAVEHWQRVWQDPKGYGKDKLVIYSCTIGGQLHWHVGHLKQGRSEAEKGFRMMT